MSNDNPGPGGVPGQVLQRPHQVALAVLEFLGDSNENLVLDSDRLALRRLAGVVVCPLPIPAFSISELALSRKGLQSRGALHGL